jgi:hypothetical protein
VAAWAIWKQYPLAWATIVAIAQVLHVAKPYLPFLGFEKDYLAMSYEFERLYLMYERLWYDFENETISEEDAGKLFYQYREHEVEIENKYRHSRCPEKNNRLIKKTEKETLSALALNFN